MEGDHKFGDLYVKNYFKFCGSFHNQTGKDCVQDDDERGEVCVERKRGRFCVQACVAIMTFAVNSVF